VTGIEPAWITPIDPKSIASANFATLASLKSCVSQSSKYILLIPRDIDSGPTSRIAKGKACKTRLFFVNS
jgi:hypothetical protein